MEHAMSEGTLAEVVEGHVFGQFCSTHRVVVEDRGPCRLCGILHASEALCDERCPMHSAFPVAQWSACHSPARFRVPCPGCGRLTGVTPTGRIWVHDARIDGERLLCLGAGELADLAAVAGDDDA